MKGSSRETTGFEIAIIGQAGRFPEARDLNEYWENIKLGKESIRFFSDTELSALGVPGEMREQSNFVPAHGELSDIKAFDAAFFGYSPKEAKTLDPQHRLFLETVWHGLEDAGIAPSQFDGLIGVFGGSSVDDYFHENLQGSDQLAGAAEIFQARYANNTDFLTTRTSYKLNLKGPSIVVQTACSTSLVAVHMACQQLISGGCDVAVAGGVSITLPQRYGYVYQEGMIFSPDGHCRPFDAKAQGTLKGDGVGVVVLRRLEDALADGDTIDAVILGSAVNNDGADKVGYSAPGINGQIEAVRGAQLVADIEPDSIGYIEAHGTGTPLGDPIEVAALTEVFSEQTPEKQFCALGSIKSNIGHLDAAAGVAGLIKTVLALKNEALPPSLNFESPNPTIDFAESPFYVNAKSQYWPLRAGTRRAGVSSFGIGGTNAHVIVEQAPVLSKPSILPGKWFLPLSAKTEVAMATLAETYTQAPLNVTGADAFFTLTNGREPLAPYRGVIVVDTPVQTPRLAASGKPLELVKQCVLLFTGQGSQYVNMARELYESRSGFREDVLRCADFLKAYDLDILSYLYPEAKDNTLEFAEALKQTEIAQPAVFVISYAVARYWQSLGIVPTAVLGHSVGEIAAACIAGIVSLSDALKMVVARGRLMQSMPPGSMLSVPLPESTIDVYLSEEVQLAAINAPGFCVLSGPVEKIAAVKTEIEAQYNIETQPLQTSHAFHSAMMEPMLPDYRQVLEEIAFQPAKVPMISSVTGQALSKVTVSYWLENVRETVRFADAIAAVIAEKHAVFLEVGPGNTLVSLAKKQIANEVDCQTIASIRHPKNQQSDNTVLDNAIAEAWVAGLISDFKGLNPSDASKGRRVHLPLYPFARDEHWVDPQWVKKVVPTDVVQAGMTPGFQQKAPFSDWFYLPSWQQQVVSNVIPSETQRIGLAFRDKDCLIETVIAGFTDTQWIRVDFADKFSAQPESLDFQIRAAEKADYQHLFQALESQGLSVDTVLHAGLLGELSGLDAQAQGFWSLFAFVQALADQEAALPRQLIVIADQSQAVLGNEQILPEKALVKGIVQVLPSEMPEINTQWWDVTCIEADLVALGNALSNGQPDAIYNGCRFGRYWALKPTPVNVPATPRSPLRNQGIYLITGGFGGMGRTFAEFLAENYQARLVLISRSEPDIEQQQWLGTLRALGANVKVFSLDIANKAELSDVVNSVTSEWGDINGVLHAAGIPGGGIIAQQTRERIQMVWQAKVAGTQSLLSVLARHPLDFMVLCSSLTSFVGLPGRADYTAANAFLDAVAQRNAISGAFPVYAINWDNWDAIGMGAQNAAQDAEIADRIDVASGIKVLQTVLSQTTPQLLVSTRYLGVAPALVAESVVPATSSESTGAPAEAKTTASLLREIWQNLLGVETVDDTDDLFESGGDSIVVIQLVARLKQQGFALTNRQVFQNSVFADLLGILEADSGTVSIPSQSVQTAFTSGETGLTAIQRWFFSHNFQHPHHWNMSAWLALPESVAVHELTQAVQAVVAHHDALRMRFVLTDKEWRQSVQQQVDVQVAEHRFDDLDEQENFSRVAQSKLELSELPVAFYLCRVANAAPRLLMIAHHLVMDLLSLRIVAEDLATAYTRLSNAEAPELPVATSFQSWSDAVYKYANSAYCAAQQGYWADRVSRKVTALPRDNTKGTNLVVDAAQQTITLSISETEMLKNAVTRSANADMQTALLAALARTMQSWAALDQIVIWLEGHGRELPGVAIDSSRTVGWFTSLYPFIVSASETESDCEWIEEVSEQFSLIPNQGMDYSLLRYLHADSAVRESVMGSLPVDIVFLYQGHVRAVSDDTWSVSKNRVPENFADDQKRPAQFEVMVDIVDGALNLSMGYSEKVYKSETIASLLDIFKNTLIGFISQPAVESSRPYLAPTSFVQERLWYLEQFEANAGLYNLQGSLLMRGSVDSDAIRKALQAVVDRHEILRTAIVDQAGTPMQQISPKVEISVPVVDLTQSVDIQLELETLRQKQVAEPFDLTTAPLIRWQVVKTGRSETRLLLTVHHIIVDYWGMTVLFNDFASFYAGFASGKTVELPPIVKPYAYFAEQQRRLSNSTPEHMDFWLEKLAGIEAPLELPADRARPDVRSVAGARVSFTIEVERVSQLRAVARAQQATPFMVMLAVYQTLLYRYTGHADMIVGVPVAERHDVEMERVVGVFVNNLVIRTDLSDVPTFGSLLRRVKQAVLEAFDHNDVPFERLVEAIKPPRDRSRTPIFQVMFTYMNAPDPDLSLDGLAMSAQEEPRNFSEFDLNLYITDKGADTPFSVAFEYSTALFDEERIMALKEHFENLLSAVLTSVEQPLNQIPMLSIETQQWLVATLNDTAMPLPEDTSVLPQLSASCNAQGEKEAVVGDSGLLTYEQLNDQANQLAHYLVKQGVGSGDLVGVMLDRDEQLIVALLAVWKAGAGYVPLDPMFPAERLAYMLEDSNANFVVTAQPLLVQLPNTSVHAICTDLDTFDIRQMPQTAPEASPASTDLAYVIYTSGSTGKPKGVQVTHHNVLNFLLSMRDCPGLSEEDQFLAVTTISFDIHVLELFLPLLVGATLVVANKAQSQSGDALMSRLQQGDITAMQATPATWQMLIESGWQTALPIKALCGGDKLSRSLADDLLERVDSLWNMFGPTETTVWSAVARVELSDKPITIGNPIANTELYVVDKEGALLPPGVLGELWIGGAGVTAGYRNREDLTTDRFIDAKYDWLIKPSRLYRTGDQAVMHRDGQIEIVGRFDQQIKLRGFRIEVGEIEQRLVSHEAIKQAVVLLREDTPGNQRLVAYLIAEHEAIDSSVLKAALSEYLPDYMVPTAWVWLEAYPMTLNNKIDRKALPKPDSGQGVEREAFVAPEYTLEKILAMIFQDVLGLQAVGRYDNFFDLGGHSLLSMKVVAKFQEETGIRLNPGELFQQTVGQIAAHYEAHGPTNLQEKREQGKADVEKRKQGFISKFSRAIRAMLK
ncbi:MAG: amino acid adenylation domain-containing protein [Gammaproteobacteria bacterium]